MSKKLVIDLAKCDRCASCGVHCGYFFRPHAEDHGILGLRERAAFELICRRCEEPSCVDSCPTGALERGADGVLVRHNLRCVSCKLCVHACPFGTILADLVPFYETPCDYCLASGDTKPPCVDSCGKGAIEFREIGPNEANVHVLDAHLAARSPNWVKREART